MAYALFNTLEYVKLLTTQGGFTQNQAEALNEAQMIVSHALLSQVATQADMKELQAATQADIKELRTEMQIEFKNIRTEMQAEFNNVRTEMQAEFKNVRTEMQAEFKNVRTEMQEEFKNVRTEMQAEFKNVRTEMQEEFNNVRTEMQGLEYRLDKKIDAIKPFVLKTMISLMLTNLTIIGLGFGAISLILT